MGSGRDGYDGGDAAHHTVEFGGHGASPSADAAVLDGAAALALVGAEIGLNLRQRTRLIEAARLRRASAPTG
jgi:hypothetical protein